MILILGFVSLTLLCFVIWQLGERLSRYGDYDGWMCVGVFLAFASVFTLIALPINHMGIKAKIKEFEAVEETLLVARANLDISQLELAAIQQEVVRANKWLAQAQYWAKHPLVNWYYPPELKNYNPIK